VKLYTKNLSGNYSDLRIHVPVRSPRQKKSKMAWFSKVASYSRAPTNFRRSKNTGYTLRAGSSLTGIWITALGFLLQTPIAKSTWEFTTLSVPTHSNQHGNQHKIPHQDDPPNKAKHQNHIRAQQHKICITCCSQISKTKQASASYWFLGEGHQPPPTEHFQVFPTRSRPLPNSPISWLGKGPHVLQWRMTPPANEMPSPSKIKGTVASPVPWVEALKQSTFSKLKKKNKARLSSTSTALWNREQSAKGSAELLAGG